MKRTRHPDLTAARMHLNRAHRIKIKADKLFAAIQDKYSLQKVNLQSVSRGNTITDVRRACMAIMRQSGFKLKDIAFYLDRSEGSVSDQLKQHKNWYNSNDAYTKIFNSLKGSI